MVRTIVRIVFTPLIFILEKIWPTIRISRLCGKAFKERDNNNYLKAYDTCEHGMELILSDNRFKKGFFSGQSSAWTSLGNIAIFSAVKLNNPEKVHCVDALSEKWYQKFETIIRAEERKIGYLKEYYEILVKALKPIDNSRAIIWEQRIKQIATPD
jgi:hypothetical protein